jgi:hypothetical protein
VRLRGALAALALLVIAADANPQTTARRLATVASLRQYPGYYHMQNVLLHGEIVESGTRLALRGGDMEIPLIMNGASAPSGTVEVRGVMIDIGRFEPGDARVQAYIGPLAVTPDNWPRPGEELIVNVTSVGEAQPTGEATIRSLALEPWRYAGQQVTIVGEFRGRNLFGDLPSAPGKSRWDFVLRTADSAVWVTDLRPRGRGFDLAVDARVDTGRWLQVTGTVAHDRGLVTLTGTTVATANPPQITSTADDDPPAPAVPLEPGEVVFSSPTDGDIDVPAASPIRIQFSRGIDPASLMDRIRVTYVGGNASGDPPEALPFTFNYDPGPRSVEIRLTTPPERFRTIRVELLDGIRTFDGAPVQPWLLMFSVGG